tara:strand:+ start:672 stop:1100 length:429 start_codon:yes stop_codon:yes gene_type:complete
MPAFNKVLWEKGKETEDAILPHLNNYFCADFKRDDDIFDILDFRDPESKKIVEVKGRTIPSTQFTETIITCGKITEGLMEMECDPQLEIYYFFVFTDRTMFIKLEKDFDWVIRRTGTNFIPHYLIPINTMLEFDENNFSGDV